MKKNSQKIIGTVISDKMDKTRVIELRLQNPHNLYVKRVIKKYKLFVHDEKNLSKVGDVVEAISTRPLSRHKHHRLTKVVQSGSAV